MRHNASCALAWRISYLIGNTMAGVHGRSMNNAAPGIGRLIDQIPFNSDPFQMRNDKETLAELGYCILRRTTDGHTVDAP